MDRLPAHPVARPRASRFWGLAALLVVVVVGIVGLTAAGPFKRGTKVGVAGYRIVAEYPHDAAAFTQGLVFVDDQLYEGTGTKGASSLRRVDLDTGKVEQIVPLDSSYFGEGIAVLGGKIYQLTWQNRLGIVYDQQTLNPVGTFRYTGEGWGLTHDGKRLIMSDGTSTLRMLDPKTFQVVKRLSVRASNGPVDKLNELDYMNGEILANIWYSDRIARISPETGEILGWIDLSGLYPAAQRASREHVLNGIAYDEAHDRLFVTGKNWPKLYEIKVVPAQ